MEATPWLDKMKSYIGEKCETGKAATPFVEEAFKHTNFGPLHGVAQPWCAATLNRVLAETGYKGTNSAAAISFKNYGSACEMKPGAIVVFQFPGNDHHVTLCDHPISAVLVACVGGNQHHELCEVNFRMAHVIAIRWPEKA